ncbi:hypothetical protein FSP39_015095 [Pinctada imbricata]|uniref:RING-type domain-containing protein n=1 Tax=Pinctada imbricata TaxID=66713 RepID=A0AA88YRE4_PINIB|nr:hypothetical protein FSP39_015095 [Pinctada imbricata]
MTNELEIEDTVGTELVNLLKCNICWEFFTEPTILPCGHTFCYTCLQEIGRHTIKNAKALLHNPKIVINIYCPNCRWAVPYKDVQLKKNGVRFNFALNSVKDHIKEIKVDASTNTETTSLEDAKLQEIESSLESVFLALRHKGSVLNDAREAIEEVRNDASLYYNEQDFVEEKLGNCTLHPSPQQAQFTTPRAAISQSAWAKWQKFCDDKQGALNFKPRSTSSFKEKT